MSVDASYYPETKKLNCPYRYRGYFAEAVILSLPVELLLNRIQEAYVLSSHFDFETGSPLPTYYLGKGELRGSLRLAGSTTVDIDLVTTYAMIEKIEQERKGYTERNGSPGDVIVSVKGDLTMIEPNTKVYYVNNLIVRQGRNQIITIRDSDWLDLLNTLGYPRKKIIVVNEEVSKVLDEYKTRKKIRETDDAILDAIKRSELSQKTN